MLKLDQVSFAYSPEFSLHEINFSVDHGEFVAIVGKNGSGKTTLTRVIMALTPIESGHVFWHGRDLAGSEPADLARFMGYVFQNPDLIFFHSTAEEEVAYGLRQLKVEPKKIQQHVTQAFAAVELTGQEKKNPRLMTKGEKQRLAIACTLAMEPELYLLDEPTCGQDMPFRDKLMTMLTGLCHQGKSILVVTHDMEIVEKFASRVLVLNQGNLVFDGSPTQLFKDIKQALSWGLKVSDANVLSQNLANVGISPTGSLTQLAEQIRLRRGQ
ncbi:energy-coupling factor transport system ATP-binding protein [Sporomusaceae bacterium BoRhaA]|uniref:energy-coupling factor ABC transporter ATP-binding protein n=1 Tax=Pelorhabdus rhamnosifermentans TaxID=2772457 RepID=UPI001C05F160|nr:ABC transporter ATP-binding protein [Pelorhabdus rhamnosifermentans]MBU2700547.1 energy-coupling factor transport system ATP-binding protein [Pelorhabdus rhamnosifermentans]